MDALEFKKLLFKTAFCCIACDGHIDDREIEEMKYIDKKTSYFEDVDLSVELDELLSNLKSRGKEIIDELFEALTNSELDMVQELLLLEVTIRLINSDEKIDENEVRFLRYLRAKLKVYDELIMDRFGPVDLLFDKKYSSFFETKDQHSELINKINLPDEKEIVAIDLSKFDTDR